MIFLVRKIKKKLSSITGSGLTLTNNEIKNIVKVIRSLENREVLLKVTIRKIISQKVINEKCTYAIT